MVRLKNGFWSRLWSNVCRWNYSFWQWYKSIYVGRPWYVKAVSGLCTMVVSVILLLIAVDINFLWLFGKSPSINEIMHPKTNNASYVYSADGVLLCKYYDENRTPVKYNQVNPLFFKALVDTEDERFYSHHGVDYTGMLAAVKDYVIHRHARGASTITQQLVKNMFKVRSTNRGLLGHVPGFGILISKIKEWILATKVELFYDKQDIITMYANTVDFGNNAFGIKTAARTYYNTTPDSLTLDQCAVLVGLLKATSSYNPRSNPERSQWRRNVVLWNMVTHGDLSQARYNEMKNEPTQLHINIETPNDGRALYFRNAVHDEMQAWCEENDVDFYTDGLKIYTTVDSRVQEHAEEAVMQQMYQVQHNFERRWGSDPCWVDNKGDSIPGFPQQVLRTTDYYKQMVSRFPHNPDSVNHYMNTPHKMKLFMYDRDRRTGRIVAGYREVNMSPIDSVRHMLHFMHCGLVAIEPRTGFVRAWVGDIDYTTWKYDKVKSMRQPGSTFKLFVYSAAMESGMTPCSTERDDYLSMNVFNEQKNQWEQYTPRNANGDFSGQDMSLRQAFVQSINVVAVRTGTDERVGMEKVRKTAQAMGIKSPLVPMKATEAKPSLCLGAMDVNLLELTNAYGTVANYGKEHDPVLVTKIVRVEPDGSETVLYNYKDHQQEEQAISPQSAFYMQQMLMAGITDAGGTSNNLESWVGPYMSTTDFGGKTGTSQNHSDAWFVGVTPNLVAGVWVGGEYRSIHFTSTQGQGGKTAMPICGAFFEKVFQDSRLRPSYTGRFVSLGLPPSSYDCDPQPVVRNDEPADEPAMQEVTDSLGAGEPGAEGDMGDMGAEGTQQQAPAAAEEPGAENPAGSNGGHKRHNNAGGGNATPQAGQPSTGNEPQRKK